MRYSTRLIELLFPSIVCRTSSKDVHLTFDDGPHPVATPAVLDILAERAIRAVFFVSGEKAKQYPDLVRRAHREGHAVANHAYSHRSLFLKSEEFIRTEIKETDKLIESLQGAPTALFRPPFGSFDFRTLRVARDLGHRVVLWSYDSRDFEVGFQESLNLSPRASAPGSIILLHDNEATAGSVRRRLPQLLASLQGRGATFSLITV